MRKTYLLLALLLLVIGLIVVTLIISSRQARTTEQKTNKESFPSGQQLLRVQQTNPLQGEYHNPFLPLKVTFNRAINPENLSFSLVPDTDVRVLPGKDQFTLQLIPAVKFLPETNYSLSIETEPPFVLQFKTEQSASNPPGWNELFGQSYDDYREQYGTQDDALIKIRRSVPISEKQFTVTYSYANNTYTLTLKPPFNESKEAAFSWLRAQGVTDLTTLRIKWGEQR